jgi:hypothetical protein
MKKIRKYAIHRLSTDAVLSPVEKILLARAHQVAVWLDEGVTSLVKDDGLKFEDLVTLGWEIAARILWIRDASRYSLNAPGILRFRRDDIKCARCSSSSSLINGDYNCAGCHHAVPKDAELTIPSSGSVSGNGDCLSTIYDIVCHRKPACAGKPFCYLTVTCNSCLTITHPNNRQVRITPWSSLQGMIREMFGEEIKEYELATSD